MKEQVLIEARKLIAGFLRSRREELGITQVELAEKCGVTWQTISRIENAKFMPKMDHLLTMCHHLNCYFFLEAKEGDSELIQSMRERWGKINNN